MTVNMKTSYLYNLMYRLINISANQNKLIFNQM